MTALPMCMVTPKPVFLEAVRFDGTEAAALAIIAWIRSGENADLPMGHYRPPAGAAKAALYQPLLGTVMSAQAGQWVVKKSGMLFMAYTPEAFAKSFEVVP